MRQIWVAAFLTTFLLVNLANAAGQAQKEEAASAKGKAEVLEEKASGEGSKTIPTAAEIITKPQAQSVDPVGEEPLDDAITCLARSIYMTPREDEPYSHAKEIARKALNRQLQDRSDGALYFHNRKVTPNWSTEYIKTVEVGEHIFYKPAGGKAK
jgi:spore germination cell wall hydrolase CwlJ-like protein